MLRSSMVAWNARRFSPAMNICTFCKKKHMFCSKEMNDDNDLKLEWKVRTRKEFSHSSDFTLFLSIF